MIASGTIAQVRIGSRETLPDGFVTAYRKQRTQMPLAVQTLGLDGDTQVNKRYHGGPEKAVYSYPLSGYPDWIQDFPTIAERFHPGAMGENLVIDGQDEDSICIGDIIRAGTALLQVSQIREPCATFARILGTPKVVRAMVRSGRSGWYSRVLEPGALQEGSPHTIIERPNPKWTMRRFSLFTRGEPQSNDDLAELASLPGLTPAWAAKATRALASGRA